ncbi:hypothetical protein HK405_008495 [Cladochytrium tenue]|nr:hypothetical protein HK405_008495 [Cladochytrium tenue]
MATTSWQLTSTVTAKKVVVGDVGCFASKTLSGIAAATETVTGPSEAVTKCCTSYSAFALYLSTRSDADYICMCLNAVSDASSSSSFRDSGCGACPVDGTFQCGFGSVGSYEIYARGSTVTVLIGASGTTQLQPQSVTTSTDGGGTTSTTSASGMPTAVIAGIVAGLAVLTACALFAIIAVWRRRSAARKLSGGGGDDDGERLNPLRGGAAVPPAWQNKGGDLRSDSALSSPPQATPAGGRGPAGAGVGYNNPLSPQALAHGSPVAAAAARYPTIAPGTPASQTQLSPGTTRSPMARPVITAPKYPPPQMPLPPPPAVASATAISTSRPFSIASSTVVGSELGRVEPLQSQ